MTRALDTNFDPAFGRSLQGLQDFLRAQGVETTIISGRRTPEEHKMAWENYIAGKQGRALPYPDFGSVPRATPMDQVSPHDVGFGADLEAVNPADQPKVWAAAPQFGIRAIGSSDPAHVELVGWQKAQGGGQPAQKATTPMDLYGNLSQIESSHRNIPSEVDKDYAGQPGSKSQGFWQIDTPTWRQFAPKAGIDITKFPNAMSADEAIQHQVVGMIPLSRFGPQTQVKLQKIYGTLDQSKTIGELASGAAPNEPSIAARGNVMPEGGVAVTATPTPTIGQQIKQGDVAGALQQLTAKDEKTGKSKLDSIFPDKERQRAAPVEAPPLAPAMDPMASMAPGAQALFSQVLAQGARPLSWSSRPYGWDAGPQVPGTSMNSMGGQIG